MPTAPLDLLLARSATAGAAAARRAESPGFLGRPGAHKRRPGRVRRLVHSRVCKRARGPTPAAALRARRRRGQGARGASRGLSPKGASDNTSGSRGPRSAASRGPRQVRDVSSAIEAFRAHAAQRRSRASHHQKSSPRASPVEAASRRPPTHLNPAAARRRRREVLILAGNARTRPLISPVSPACWQISVRPNANAARTPSPQDLERRRTSRPDSTRRRRRRPRRTPRPPGHRIRAQLGRRMGRQQDVVVVANHVARLERRARGRLTAARWGSLRRPLGPNRRRPPRE